MTAQGRTRSEVAGTAEPREGARDRVRFERKPEDLIAMLLTVQRGLGYLPEDALLEVAKLTRLPTSTVFGVATFYEQFRLHPAAGHSVRLCTGTPCHLRGARRILDELEAAFAVRPGETSEDGSFTLETVGCFGPCALAPVMVVDDVVKGNMTPAKACRAVGRLRGPDGSHGSSDGTE
jgi:NADH:ubiquinone oxidoreductase subunit E